jgi:hypothetical protein
LVKPQTKKMAVKGAWMLALKTAAIPIIIKLIGITPILKKVFKTEATNNPRNAPIKRLGAKTPPSQVLWKLRLVSRLITQRRLMLMLRLTEFHSNFQKWF